LDSFLDEDNRRKQFERNLSLIAFHEIEDELEQSEWTPDWDAVRTEFINRDFWSITNDKSWSKFTNTFQHVS